MNETDIRKEKILSSQKRKLIKREEKFFNKKENEYLKNKILPVKKKIEEKIPEKMIDTFQKAFEKAFYYVFKKGTIVIEKSYNSERLKSEADINEYILSKKVNNKNLSRIDKKVRKGVLINKSITTAEGTVLGVFGIGLPDIPLFISIILKTVYEICLNYGFDYDSNEEKIFILNIICASINKTSERNIFSNELDRIGYNIDHGISNNKELKNMIKITSRNLSESVVISKIIQGIPIVGIYGGISNFKVISDLSEVASIKYKKRFISKL